MSAVGRSCVGDGPLTLFASRARSPGRAARILPAIIPRVEDLVQRAIAAVARHPAVAGVELAGSRSRETHAELSDWDLAVDTDDFDAVAGAMPELVAPLRPLAAQWEPLGHFPVYMVILRGPVKVEYLFLEHSQPARAPVEPGPGTLAAIDAHFWDWIWWIATKASIGRDDLTREHWPQLHRHLLAPMGAPAAPDGIEAAVRIYLARRHELERAYGVAVDRALEDEVRAGMRRLGFDT